MATFRSRRPVDKHYYQFVCKADQLTFDLIAELGIGDKMAGYGPRWVTTSMVCSLVSATRFRSEDYQALADREAGYGTMMFFSTSAPTGAVWKMFQPGWITRWYGSASTSACRRRCSVKFFEYADNISAAWIWTDQSVSAPCADRCSRRNSAISRAAGNAGACVTRAIS